MSRNKRAVKGLDENILPELYLVVIFKNNYDESKMIN